MEGFLAGLGVSVVTVFVAELGDKTQLLTLALATRFRPWLLIAGLAVTIALLTGLAVGVGAVLRVSLPERPIAIVAGLLFLGFGLWTLRPTGERRSSTASEDEPRPENPAGNRAPGRDSAPPAAEVVIPAGWRAPGDPTGHQLGPLVTAMAAFFFAELGDKTQLASLTLATTYPPLGVWLGATLGMLGANGLAVGVGRWLGARLPERPIRVGSAVLFLLFGIVLLWQGLRA